MVKTSSKSVIVEVSNEVRNPWALSMFMLTAFISVSLAICYAVGAIFELSSLLRIYPLFTAGAAIYGTFTMILVGWCIWYITADKNGKSNFSWRHNREVYSAILVDVVVLVFYLAYQLGYLQKYYGTYTNSALIPPALAPTPPVDLDGAYRSFTVLYAITFFFFSIATASNLTACVALFTPELKMKREIGNTTTLARLSTLYESPNKKSTF